MSSAQGTRQSLRRRLSLAAPVAACLILGASPHLARLKTPSLYADDVDRVAQLRTGTLGGILFAPFNEHVAPLFQVVSWTTWRLAGGRLAQAPLAFTLASFLPFVLTLAVLWRVLKRETRSDAAALVGLAVFSVSWLSIETVWWYSASSFMWSLLGTLTAWSAIDAGGGRSRRWLALLASTAAPSFSMIGILAGPVAAVKAVSAGGRRAWRDALAALAGSLLFLAVYGLVYERGGVESSAGVWPGLIAVSRAPAAALVPAVVGLRTLPTSGANGLFLSLVSAAAALGLFVWAWKTPGERPTILSGLALIVGGYTLAFCARAGAPNLQIMEVQRYHLFPMLGFVLVLTPGLRFAFGASRRPVPQCWLAVLLVALLVAAHRSELRGRARFLRFPDQAATLATLDRLDDVCAREGVSRAQAIAALGPWPADWAPPGRSVGVLLGPCATR